MSIPGSAVSMYFVTGTKRNYPLAPNNIQPCRQSCKTENGAIFMDDKPGSGDIPVCLQYHTKQLNLDADDVPDPQASDKNPQVTDGHLLNR